MVRGVVHACQQPRGRRVVVYSGASLVQNLTSIVQTMNRRLHGKRACRIREMKEKEERRREMKSMSSTAEASGHAQEFERRSEYMILLIVEAMSCYMACLLLFSRSIWAIILLEYALLYAKCNPQSSRIQNPEGSVGRQREGS